MALAISSLPDAHVRPLARLSSQRSVSQTWRNEICKKFRPTREIVRAERPLGDDVYNNVLPRVSVCITHGAARRRVNLALIKDTTDIPDTFVAEMISLPGKIILPDIVERAAPSSVARNESRGLHPARSESGPSRRQDRHSAQPV